MSAGCSEVVPSAADPVQPGDHDIHDGPLNRRTFVCSDGNPEPIPLCGRAAGNVGSEHHLEDHVGQTVDASEHPALALDRSHAAWRARLYREHTTD